MEEIKSKLSPMEIVIVATLKGFCKTIDTIENENVLALVGLDYTSAHVVRAALEEYVSSMEG